MSGIYLHIPFCKQACHYCDFHFSTSLALKNSLISALQKELIGRKQYLGSSNVQTIYFGGGTPSLLTPEELQRILETIQHNYSLDLKEVTIEVNPDDLDEEKLLALKGLGFNRLSIGIQTLDDAILHFMNRAHTSREGLNSVRLAQKVGFENISIDLIYGIPGLSLDKWKASLDEVHQLGIQHISAYCLTIEDKTVFGHRQQKGQLEEMEDEAVLDQIDVMNKALEGWGFERYEISNFAQKGFISRHNSSYWSGKKYLGIGPSAHSYDQQSRQWNVSNNARYIDMIEKEEFIYEREELTAKDITNEMLLTGLRTIWGVTLSQLPIDIENIKGSTLKELMDNDFIKLENGTLLLTDKGKVFADKIAADLFL